jgi:hypothetical protein
LAAIAGAAALVTLIVTGVLINIFERKLESRNPFYRVVELTDETEDPELRAHPDEALGAKPLWQKLAIVFAGPAMNLMLPVVIFAVTLFIGMPRPAPVVGAVEAGSPAERAGLLPGDRLLALADEPIAWWGDFEDLVRKQPGEALALRYQRGGETRETQFEVTSRAALDEFGKARDMGWVGLAHRRLTAMVGPGPGAGAPRQAPLGDVIVSWRASRGGWSELAAALRRASGPLRTEIERGSEPPSA